MGARRVRCDGSRGAVIVAGLAVGVQGAAKKFLEKLVYVEMRRLRLDGGAVVDVPMRVMQI